MTKFRRITGGVHRFKLNGKGISIKPGGIVECTVEDLGKHAEQYEEISNVDTAKTPLEMEISRIEFLLRDESIWLNEPKRPDNAILWITPPKDLLGLQQCLMTKTALEFDADGASVVGELPAKKSYLRELWQEWRLKCKEDPLGRLDPHKPRDKHLELIALTQAQINILEAEVKEIERRIQTALLPIKAAKEDHAKRLRFAGRTRCNKDYKIIWCDGRDVVQDTNNKPVFADDGKSVLDYIEQCKEHKRKKTALQRASRKAEKTVSVQ